MFETLLKKIGEGCEARHIPYMITGGQAVLIYGEPRLTKDIDVIRPEVLPEPIQNGAAHIARIRRRDSAWINCDVSNMLLQTKRSKA